MHSFTFCTNKTIFICASCTFSTCTTSPNPPKYKPILNLYILSGEYFILNNFSWLFTCVTGVRLCSTCVCRFCCVVFFFFSSLFLFWLGPNKFNKREKKDNRKHTQKNKYYMKRPFWDDANGAIYV